MSFKTFNSRSLSESYASAGTVPDTAARAATTNARMDDPQFYTALCQSEIIENVERQKVLEILLGRLGYAQLFELI
jgi:hypothetical protein